MTQEEVFVLPVSYAQRRLWLVDRMEPGSPLYNLPVAWRLRGPLDRAALAGALNAIAARHEVLRTTFEVEEGEPVQVVSPHRPRPLPLVDLAGLPEPRAAAEADRVLAAEAARPFDLARGPLFRPLLVRRAADDHAFLAGFHHIVADGRSLAVFARDLSALYGGMQLPDLAIQYADFAVWQREWLEGGEMEEQLAWWRERLAGAPPVQELPFLRTAGTRNRRGAARTRPLPSAPALEEMGRREGATPFVALLAAFQALLFRLTPGSGRTDVVVGTPVDNRAQEETAGLIGLFVNTLVLRTDFAGDPDFRGLLGRVRKVALEAYAHQDLPFERLVEELRPERDLDQHPVVQVVFGLQEGTGGLRLAGLEVEPLEVHHGRVKLDLALSVERGRGARVDYDADLFEAPAIERLLDAFAALVEGARPDLPLSCLPILPEAARHQVVAEWSDTGAASGPGAVHQAFEAWAERTPEAPALIAGGERISYAELDARANRLAHHLRGRGVGPETRVAVVLRHSPERVAVLLAVLKAGGAYVSLDPGDPAERRASVLADCGARVVISEVPEVSGPATNPGVAVDGEQVAYVIYTSGSTGRPKGVEVPHRGLLALVRWHRRVHGVTPEDRATQMAGEGFDASVWELWPYLAAGAAVLFPPEEARANPAALVPWLAAAGVTICFLPTPVAELALDEPWPPHRLRALLVGGDRLRRRSGPAHRFRLVNHYGPTESSVVATWSVVPEEGDGPPAIGRPVDGTKALILDRSGRPVPAGVAGELCLGGESLARGYLGRPDLTAERFVPDAGGGRLYRTGDLVRHRGDGEIEFLGRLDHQIKIRGVRIEPGEVEAALMQHPEVREAVVTVREGRLVAYLTPCPPLPSPAALPPGEGERSSVAVPSLRPSSPSHVPPLPGGEWEGDGRGGQGVRSFLAARLPAAMVPSAFVAMDALPLTPNGKVDLRALPDPEWDGGSAAPRTPAEELLAAIWCGVLGRPAVGIHDGFFDLGGHSLLATRVVSRVRATFGVELPLRALFEAPTVAGLAERIAARRGGEVAPPVVPVSRDGELPASFAQERLWFLDLLESGGAAYNVPAALRLRGPLSVPALAAALEEVVRRHEALRTTFRLDEDMRVLQVVSPDRSVPLPLIEVMENEARRVLAEEAARPFDLARGPLLRARLLRTGPEDHVLLLAMHHIVSDGWSMGVLLRELARLYEGGSLPPLPIQYADYAVWQREWLRGEILERQLAWWRDRLAGLPPLLELPADRPRPPVQGTRGGRMERPLEVNLAGFRGATLFMALLAGFQALLGRLTGREDPPVGAPIANRQRAETEGVIGLFVNTLALPADLSGDPTFADLLARVRDLTLDAYAHQDLPFEKLVEELRPERGLSHAPVFQVMLIVQNAPPAPQTMAGLDLRPLPLDTGTAKLDLTLGVVEGGRLLQAEYARDLFDRSTVARLLGSLAGLLAAAVADPGRRLSDLPLLAGCERHQILVEWNDTAAPSAESCLHDLVAAQAVRTPDAVAVICRGERVTYAELMRRSRRLANHLRGLGVGDGDERPVGVCLERSPDLVAALLGILQAGGAYVPLDPAWPAERLALLLDDCERGFDAPLVVTREPLLERLGRPVRAVCLDREALRDESPPRAGVRPDHLAYLIYTSGSTGRPKAVAIEHRSAAALVAWAAEVFPAADLAGVLAATSISFDLSVFELFVPLALGGTVILADDALALADLPEAGEVRLVNTVPSAMAELVRLEALPPSVRTVALAGEPLSPALVAGIERHRPGVRVLDLYGPSEDTTYSTIARRRGDGPATVGRPLANGRAHVLDRWQRPAPAGAPGEVWLGGAGLARGYLHRPELTAERFVPDPFSGAPGARLYRTGDLARFRPDGRLELLGRIDHQVKLRGFRIELGEIEAALLAHPDVREAAVLALGDGGDRRLVAWVAGREAGVRDHLAARLPAHMVPSAIGLLDALPRLPNGKVDRRALAALGSPGEMAGSGFVAPATEDEIRMAALWAEVLGVSRVGLHDDFFRLGGHSLLATRVVARLRRDFGVELPLRSLFQAPTVSRLLEAMKGQAEPAPAAPRIATLSRSASNLRSRSSIGRREAS